NKSLSELPREIGFNANWVSAARGGGDDSSGSSGGGRGRRGSSGGGGRSGAFPIVRERYEDTQRAQVLHAGARTPPPRLMIGDTPEMVTITNELGQSRTLHPSGRQEPIDIQGVSITVTTRRNGDRLEVSYRVSQDREVHYTYSQSVTPRQLIVEL